MKTSALRLKALALALLLVGGSLGLPVVDLIVWHLGGAHSATVSQSGQPRNGTEGHDRQCVFTHQMPSPRPAAPAVDAVALCPTGTVRPAEQPTSRLISAEVQRSHPPRAPPSLLA